MVDYSQELNDILNSDRWRYLLGEFFFNPPKNKWCFENQANNDDCAYAIAYLTNGMGIRG